MWYLPPPTLPREDVLEAVKNCRAAEQLVLPEGFEVTALQCSYCAGNTADDKLSLLDANTSRRKVYEWFAKHRECEEKQRGRKKK